MEQQFKELVKIKCEELKINIIAIECNEDHVHMFVNCLPTLSPSDIMHKIKGFTSKLLRTEFVELSKMPNNKSTGEVRHPSGTGKVGLDIGPSTIAIVSHQDVKLLESADRVHDIEKQKKLLLRKMDRSRRATNIDNYNKDGTIKKSKKWVRSNHYNKALARLKELYNKQARIRKEQHEILANYIISLGDEIYVETMNFAGLAKKGKLETNTDGRYKRRKRFGKSIGNRAPAMIIDIINRKLSYYNCSINKINTIKARASQFNHIDGTYIKNSLANDGLR